MKRSEILEHIRAELRETMRGLSISNEKTNKYFWRRSKDLLDMLEGFGMQPPGRLVEADRWYTDYVYEWEPEDDV